MIFLLQYDREKGRLVTFETFDEGDRQSAQDARLNLEVKLLRAGIQHEVVLLEAPDREALQRTHRRYFATLSELAHAVEG